MRVRLLRDWGDARYLWAPAGTCRDVDEATGQQLLNAGVADPVHGLEVAVVPVQATATLPRSRARAKRKGRR